MWNFCQNLDFLTYVNFSLSAKFNRFFIILGGRVVWSKKSTDFKKQRKMWFFLVFLDISNISKICDFKETGRNRGRVRYLVLFGFFADIRVKTRASSLLYPSFYSRSIFACFIWNWDENQIPRQHPFSNISNISTTVVRCL